MVRLIIVGNDKCLHKVLYEENRMRNIKQTSILFFIFGLRKTFPGEVVLKKAMLSLCIKPTYRACIGVKFAQNNVKSVGRGKMNLYSVGY